MSDPHLIHANGVQLCVQSFGDPAHPAVLLVAGGASSMDWWEAAFCERLAAAGRFVLRYDQRDTGRSRHAPLGEPDYSMDDLARDALALLDTFGIGPAQVVGISMGGTVAMRMALLAPRRVGALALISATPGERPSGPKLPPMSPALAAFFEGEAAPPDWTDRRAVIDHIVGSLGPFSGRIPVDDTAARALAGQIFDRSDTLETSETNHWMVGSKAPSLRDRLHEITAPTVVLHGTDDPLYPLEHGRILAREIPRASLVALEGMGHEMPPPVLWDKVIEALVQVMPGSSGPVTA
jgi:pimeloyl-ACP methyl ester carboxylesterase